MSARDLQRIEVLTEVLAGRRTTVSAATILAVSVRQTQRLLTRYRDGGGGALIHKARGRASNYQLSTGIRDYTLELIRQSYRDFGPTLAAEVLLERHGLQVSRETLRRADDEFAASRSPSLGIGPEASCRRQLLTTT